MRCILLLGWDRNRQFLNNISLWRVVSELVPKIAPHWCGERIRFEPSELGRCGKSRFQAWERRSFMCGGLSPWTSKSTDIQHSTDSTDGRVVAVKIDVHVHVCSPVAHYCAAGRVKLGMEHVVLKATHHRGAARSALRFTQPSCIKVTSL